MANLSPACATQKCHLPNAKRRKIIVKHEPLFGFALKAFKTLHVVAGAKSGRDQRLGFATGKDGAAVRARQNSCLDPDFANLIEGSSIRSAMLLGHLLAEDPLAQRLVIVIELA